MSVRFAGRPFLLGCVIAAIRCYFVRQPSPLLTRLFRPRPALPLDEHRLFEPAPVSWWTRIGEFLLVTIGCCGFIALATWPQVAQPYAVSDPGDPLFSVWRLMWVTHEFVRNPFNIFNGNQFYPEPRTLTFSDGLDARTSVRRARGSRTAPAGRLQHRVPVGRRFLRRRHLLPCPGTDRPEGCGVDCRGDFRDAPVPSRALRSPRASRDWTPGATSSW